MVSSTLPQQTSGAANRWFALDTPLGKDVLVVTRMVGEEGVSRLFHFELSVVSEKQSIKPEDLLAKVVTLEIGCFRGGAAGPETPRDRDRDRSRETPRSTERLPAERLREPEGASASGGSNPARWLNGIVTRFRAGRILQSKLREYVIEVSPKLWTAQRSSRYRVYQNQSAKDIIEKILSASGVTDVSSKLSGTYAEREYCVQYGETDFEFLTRLMHEEGVFYYFKHEQGKHTLVMEDSKSWSAGDPKLQIPYSPGDRNLSGVVNVFEIGPRVIDYKYVATDYDFEAPNTAIKEETQTDKKGADSSWQHQIHGVGLPKSDSATKVSKIDIESAESGYETGAGQGSVPHFTPGLTFEITGFGKTPTGGTDPTRQREPDRDERDEKDDPTRRRRQATDGTGSGGASQEDQKYVVTEVRHDGIEPGRFTQDADAPKRGAYRNEFVFVRQEVPLPRPVPPQKPLARGPMTALVVGPSGSEIHTDKYGRIRVQFYWDQDGKKDDKSSCFIRVAQPWSGKNWGAVFIPRVGMEVVVQFLDGDPDRPLVTGTVYNGTNLPPWTLPDKMTKSGIMTRSTKDGAAADANELSFDDDKGKEIFLLHAQRDLLREVENDEKITVDHDQITEVKNDRTITIKEGNDTLTVKTGNQTHEVTQGNRSHTIKTGNDTLEVSTGNRAVTVKTGNHDLKLNTGNVSVKCDVGQIKMEATTGITLVCGQNKIELTPSGITVNGIMVSIKGTAMLEEKAPIVTVKGDGMTTIEGGLVKIN